jgi:hypothetical protein
MFRTNWLLIWVNFVTRELRIESFIEGFRTKDPSTLYTNEVWKGDDFPLKNLVSLVVQYSILECFKN